MLLTGDVSVLDQTDLEVVRVRVGQVEVVAVPVAQSGVVVLAAGVAACGHHEHALIRTGLEVERHLYGVGRVHRREEQRRPLVPKRGHVLHAH